MLGGPFLCATSGLMDLPARMRHLPVYQGLPIPFFTLVRDGRPDFRVHSSERHARAMLKRLCGVCGDPLDYWLTFIAGPIVMRERLSYMPAMHDECARASLVLCPFLALEERTHRDTPVKEGDIRLAGSLVKPPRTALAKTRSYEIVRRGPEQGMEYAQFAPPKYAQWYEYKDGALVAC